jgi:hypothetical protein
MNDNFDELGLKALNRTAPILQATLDLDATGTYDLGTAVHKFRDGYFSRNVTIGGTLGVTGATTLAGLTATTGSFSSTLGVTGATTLSSTLNVTGLITGSAGATITGTVTATTFSGAATSLTGIPAAQLTGTIASAVQDAITRTGTVASGTWDSGLGTNAQNTIVRTGTVLTGTWSASFGAVSGANLTNLTAGNITGSHTLADGVLSTNVPLLNASSTNVFTGAAAMVFGVGTTEGGIRTDGGGVMRLQGGTNGFQLRNNSNSATLATLDNSGVLTVNGFGGHSFAAAGTGNNSLTLQNTSAGTSNEAALLVANDTNKSLRFDSFSSTWISGGDTFTNGQRIVASGAGGLSISASDAAGVIRFYTAGTLRWGINAAGDLTTGIASHISESAGTPSISGGTGFGTGPAISGVDYAFVITVGTAGGGSAGGGTVTLGHTCSNTVIPSLSWSNAIGQVPTVGTVTTSSVQILPTSPGTEFATGGKIYVHVKCS